MVSSLTLLSRESSVFVKESPDRKKGLSKTCIRIYRRFKSYVNIQCKFVFFVFFFYVGFLLRTFTIHRTAGEGGGYLFNSSLSLPPTSQTFRH